MHHSWYDQREQIISTKCFLDFGLLKSFDEMQPIWMKKEEGGKVKEEKWWFCVRQGTRNLQNTAVVKKPQKAVPADDPLWFPRIGMLRLDLLTWLWETIQLDWPTFRWKRDCKVSSHDSVSDCKRLNYLVAKHLSFLDWPLKGEGLKFLHCSVVCSPFNHTGRQWHHHHFWCLRLTTSFPSS